MIMILLLIVRRKHGIKSKIRIMSKKSPDCFAIRAFKLLPRKCRLGGSPVPFR